MTKISLSLLSRALVLAHRLLSLRLSLTHSGSRSRSQGELLRSVDEYHAEENAGERKNVVGVGILDITDKIVTNLSRYERLLKIDLQ